MTWYLDTAAGVAFLGLLAGVLVPGLVARIPEPLPDPTEADTLTGQPEAEAEPAAAVEEPKEAYAAIAALPGLRSKAALACAVAGGLLGGTVGWAWSLLFLVYLVPVGVALAVVDWRTRLLPTKVIAPSYVVVALLALLAAALGDDWGDLRRAAYGWLLAGGSFLLLWLVYPRGMGYGDVRLSGVLGIALGYLGWAELLTGVYAGFVLGGVGGLLLSLLRLVDRKAYPFGPFMLLGALLGVVLGQPVADLYLSA